MRTIKTYTNGRFYDTLDKKYIRREELVARLEKKEAIEIIMHKTGKDVTAAVIKRLAPSLSTPKESRLNLGPIKKWAVDQVDRRIGKAIALINLPNREQVSQLTADIEKLTKRVEGLQKRLVRPTP
jgi:polyhydroxyalkanoate synthesis regulator phasin